MIPLISIFAPAIKTLFWEELHRILSTSSIDFEIVYAGFKSPTFILPQNFKFILTDVTPAQAAHIAFSQTVGEYVIFMPDDMVPEHDFLDLMLGTILKHDQEKTVVTPYYSKKQINTKKFTFPEGPTPGYGIYPTVPMLCRKIFMELGGIDRRFINIGFGVDIALRLCALGGTIVRCHTWVCEMPGMKYRRLCKRSKEDGILLDHLWPKCCLTRDYYDLEQVRKGRSDDVISY